MQPLVVAVLGATGVVGRKIIELLDQRDFPLSELRPLASKRSLGQTITYKSQQIPLQEATPEAFDGVNLVLASAGGKISEWLVPEAVLRGAVVIDNSSHYRMDARVPLVVGGVNDDALGEHQGVVANPNCSTAQLMPVLKTLSDAAGLKRVVVSTYQSVSGAGKEGLDGLATSTRQLLEQPEAMETIAPFQRPIGGNLIPHIDVFMDDEDVKDYTKEEVKLIRESRKILGLPYLKITATAVRVPVMVGHSESVTVDLERPLTPVKAAKLLKNTQDVVVAENREDYHTPLETAGTDPVYVSRLRRDTSNPTHGLHCWVVSDNLRIGAALNAVRLAEGLVAKDLVSVPEHSRFLSSPWEFKAEEPPIKEMPEPVSAEAASVDKDNDNDAQQSETLALTTGHFVVALPEGESLPQPKQITDEELDAEEIEKYPLGIPRYKRLAMEAEQGQGSSEDKPSKPSQDKQTADQPMPHPDSPAYKRMMAEKNGEAAPKTAFQKREGSSNDRPAYNRDGGNRGSGRDSGRGEFRPSSKSPSKGAFKSQGARSARPYSASSTKGGSGRGSSFNSPQGSSGVQRRTTPHPDSPAYKRMQAERQKNK